VIDAFGSLKFHVVFADGGRCKLEAGEIRALRVRLKLTMAQLGEKLGVSQSTVTQWELGERFPTKVHVGKLRALEKEQESTVKNAPRDEDALWAPFLGTPEFASLLRKLLFHPALRQRALELAAAYADPAAR
jgi:transcriptional regulator with XRE-family HTH domain